MSISVKGYIKSSCTDLFLVRSKLEKCLAKHAISNSNIFKYGPIEYQLESSCLFANFNNPEPRRLYIGFQTVQLEKWIVFDLTDWGNAREIIQDCLKEFSDLGECYYHESDCVGEPVKFKAI
jgi:hypothetical protein